MKPIYLIILSLLFAGCAKNTIAPVSSKINTSNTNNISNTQIDDYWYNGTKGTAVIRVTCNNCSAIATVGTATTPFLFNDQGVGLLKYTPTSGLSVYIAVCPGSVKQIKAEILDAKNTAIYTYSGVIDNWNTTYVIK
jgi:enoyl reductase-like protein